jgi:ABC-type nitrate/sulfonate/bicarbonate transport system substrate-binding protein
LHHALRTNSHHNRQHIRLGFTALTDCAPLVMAQQLGLFEQHGIAVALSREVGWATIRDKIIHGELDAAHAPAGMLVAIQSGIGARQSDCLTGLVLNLHGNAITLSQELWDRGVRNGTTLRDYITHATERLTFGVVYQHSSHSFILRNWLRSHCIHPERDVQLVVVPPAQVHSNLKAGHLDGYCAGEPWNSLAIMSGTGWVVATSAELEPRHPEKVLMVRRSFAEWRESEHLALIAALTEACRFCDAPENRERVIETIAQPEFVNAPAKAVRMSLGGKFDCGNARAGKAGGQHIFHSEDANDPSPDKARWVIENLVRSGTVPDPALIAPDAAERCFRSDIFHQALQPITS